MAFACDEDGGCNEMLLKQMPKIELHAHLSGSVRESTLFELIDRDQKLKHYGDTLKHSGRTLDEDFLLFPIVHILLNDRSVLERVTREIIEDFRAENCVYLELRTTPRCITKTTTARGQEEKEEKIILDKAGYLETVLNVIESLDNDGSMIVRLLLSIDRSKGVQDALDTIELCHRFKSSKSSTSKYIVGIDFSGNPKSISFKEYDNLFKLIRQYGLKFTVHIGEFWHDPDLYYIVNQVRPDRLGHCICLNDAIKRHLLANPIPIEVCPTSNLKTISMKSLSDDHPFYEFYSHRYPLCICTDDSGIFQTNLTRENQLIMDEFKLCLDELFRINFNSIEFIFDQTNETKEQLEKKFREFKLNKLENK